ncbi:hypothetical protein [Ralstonia solanacearum]|uniref:hypothetical protein n=1 Tax=Ralstonia solanacearum TaxID=305 RepID=UPI001595EDB2|nr:hypothetical protein [Ralstonia solanacearum]
MQTENTAQPTFRAYVVLACIYLLAIGLLFHGWDRWAEGSVRIQPKHAESYIAMRGGTNEGSFYIYVVGYLAGGFLFLLVGLFFTWLILFSRNLASKAIALKHLNTPVYPKGSPRIPTWLFFGVVTFVVCIFAYAFVSVR